MASEFVLLFSLQDSKIFSFRLVCSYVLVTFTFPLPCLGEFREIKAYTPKTKKREGQRAKKDSAVFFRSLHSNHFRLSSEENQPKNTRLEFVLTRAKIAG